MRIELGDLLASAVDDLLRAQSRLDDSALAQRERLVTAPSGTLSLPPLWYTFRNVVLDLELSAAVKEPQAADRAKLLCGIPSLASVALYGREAAVSMHVRLTLAPKFLPELENKDGHQDPADT